MMRPQRFTPLLPSLMLAVLLTACGGGDSPQRYVPPPKTWYVNEQIGNDANPGSGLAPFATISMALSVVQSGEVIQVAPGSYTPIHETFPLLVPPGVRLVGDPDHYGGDDGPGGIPPTVIRGGALGGLSQPTSGGDRTTSLVLEADSSLEGFQVIRDRARGTGGPSEWGVRVWGDGVRIERCRFLELDTSVAYEQPPGGTAPQGGHFVGNYITESLQGVTFEAGVTGIRVSSNWFYYCPFGALKMHGPGIDLGGGAAGSAGLNTFGCNGSDIYADDPGGAGYTVYAMGNSWDRLPIMVDYHQDSSAWSQIEADHGITFIFGATLGSVTCPGLR